jgi:hypothetical protein
MIKIRENAKPEFEVCKMVCDFELHPSLNKYDLTKFLNTHTTNLIIGRPGSGKSNLLYQLFSKGNTENGKKFSIYRKRFQNIFYFCPPSSAGSMGSNNIFDKLPNEKKFGELNSENLKAVMDYIKEEDPKYSNMIIIDDCASQLKGDAMKLLKELFMNKRHLRTSVIVVSQTWYSVPKDIRRLFDNLFCFRVSKDEMNNIMNEIVESKKQYADEISRIVFNKKYKWMFININTQRIFDGFDELIFPDDDGYASYTTDDE